MVREILKYPHPVLRKRTEEVEEISEEIKKLTQDMKETMLANQGAGLAASQIGVECRIIAVQIPGNPQVFINPKIIKKSKKIIELKEGCLSFPGLFLKIKRAKEIEIEALKENREKVSLKAEGLLARIFQHEIDHLDGVLFIDYASFWQKLKIRKKLRNFETQYKRTMVNY